MPGAQQLERGRDCSSELPAIARQAGARSQARLNLSRIAGA